MNKKKLKGESLKDRLKARSKDRIFRFVLADGTLKGAIVNASRMVTEMRTNHDLGILESLVLGHAYIAAILMSSELKGPDRLGLQVECSGPIKGFAVDANAFGEVRGYLKQVPIPLTQPLKDFNLSPFFGAGFLSVTKYLKDSKQPFTGKVMLEHGDLAKDLTIYFLKSEQKPSAFNLSIKFDKAGKVIGAGGLLLQTMPGADEETIRRIEEMVLEMPSIGDAFSKNKSDTIPRLVISKVLNHAENGITAGYDRHSYDQEKREALEAWAQELAAILRARV